MEITAVQCKMARAALGWGIRELARRARISQTTVARFENALSKPNASTLAVMQRAFEDAGIEFINGDAPGIRLRPK
jgi:transcriptional regulator with XRE-family HTH domain